MDLFKDVLIKALENEKIEVTFPGLTVDAADLVEMRSYAALCKIKEIVDDERLDDQACFHRIEEILLALEFLGSGSTRHDFG